MTNKDTQEEFNAERFDLEITALEAQNALVHFLEKLNNATDEETVEQLMADFLVDSTSLWNNYNRAIFKKQATILMESLDGLIETLAVAAKQSIELMINIEPVIKNAVKKIEKEKKLSKFEDSTEWIALVSAWGVLALAKSNGMLDLSAFEGLDAKDWIEELNKTDSPQR